MAESNVEEGKLCAILAYLFVGIIWYFVDDKMKNNSFAKYHVKQGLVLLIACMIVIVADGIFAWIPFIGWFAIFALQIGLFIIWLIGLIAAINGQEKELPVIGQFAKKFTF